MTRTFTVALPAPALQTPTTGFTETNDETPTFTWNAVAGATSYKIQLSNSATGTSNCEGGTTAGTGFTTPIIEQIVSGTSFTPTTNLADGTKHWHVKAISGSIEGCYSASRSVSIDVAPAAPTLVSPANGVFFNDNTPLFNWDDATDGSGISRYTLELATSSTLTGGAGTGFVGANIVLSQNIDGSPDCFSIPICRYSSY